MSELSDREVLDVAEFQLNSTQDIRMSELLGKQQDGELADDERSELLALMKLYQEGLLRKAQGLREAVRRGLKEPLFA